MKVLVVKMSSLGDIIHTLPALSDAAKAIPSLRFDWLVEEAFAQVPAWHPAVDQVIPTALRRWRKTPWSALRSDEWANFIAQLRQHHYDVIIDAQGLLKSAIMTRVAHGQRVGFDRQSAREGWLNKWLYDRTVAVKRTQREIERLRLLFAHSLDYACPDTPANFAIDHQPPNPTVRPAAEPYVVFIHGTTWLSKLYPQNAWIALAHDITKMGLKIHLPWYSADEYANAQAIAATLPTAAVTILPRYDLNALRDELRHAHAVVAVDTGLAYLASAVKVPTVTLYGPSDATRMGVKANLQCNLSVDFPCAPCLQRRCHHRDSRDGKPVCFTTLSSTEIRTALERLLAKK